MGIFFVYLRGLKPRDCFVGTFFLMTNDSSTVAKIKCAMILIYLWLFKKKIVKKAIKICP